MSKEVKGKIKNKISVSQEYNSPSTVSEANLFGIHSLPLLPAINKYGMANEKQNTNILIIIILALLTVLKDAAL